MNETERLAWMTLCETYKLIGTKSGTEIILALIKHERLTVKELIEKTNTNNGYEFYRVLRGLTICLVIERTKVGSNVFYELSPYGKHVLKLTKPLVKKIAKVFKGKRSLILKKLKGFD